MIGGTEPFDVYEVEGNGQLPPLISWQGQLSNWLQNNVIPDLYTKFPKVGTHKGLTVNIQFDRDISIHGKVPLKAVYPEQELSLLRLAQRYMPQLNSNVANANIVPKLQYKIPEFVLNDQKHISFQAGIVLYDLWAFDPHSNPNDVWAIDPNVVGTTHEARFKSYSGVGMALTTDPPGFLYNSAYHYLRDVIRLGEPIMPSGTYKVTVLYKLPGLDTVTTLKNIEIDKQ